MSSVQLRNPTDPVPGLTNVNHNASKRGDIREKQIHVINRRSHPGKQQNESPRRSLRDVHEKITGLVDLPKCCQKSRAEYRECISQCLKNMST